MLNFKKKSKIYFSSKGTAEKKRNKILQAIYKIHV